MRRVLIAFLACLLFTPAEVPASSYNLQLRDFALPGQTSELRIGGWCNLSFSYVYPASDCAYGTSIWQAEVVAATDKTLRLDVGTLDVGQSPQPFDRYVVFREAGINPATADDVLRVRWDPSNGLLLVDLVSGSLVTAYLNDELAGATKVGEVVNGIDEELFFGAVDPTALRSNQREVGNLFGFGADTGPAFPGFLRVSMSVVPTAFVPLPSTPILALAGVVVAFAARGRRRGH